MSKTVVTLRSGKTVAFVTKRKQVTKCEVTESVYVDGALAVSNTYAENDDAAAVAHERVIMRGMRRSGLTQDEVDEALLSVD